MGGFASAVTSAEALTACAWEPLPKSKIWTVPHPIDVAAAYASLKTPHCGVFRALGAPAPFGVNVSFHRWLPGTAVTFLIKLTEKERKMCMPALTDGTGFDIIQMIRDFTETCAPAHHMLIPGKKGRQV